MSNDCDLDPGVLTPISHMPSFSKYAGWRMADIPEGFWGFLWEKAGYGRFGGRRGVPGRLADYMETYCGFWQEPRPTWSYDWPYLHKVAHERL